eukprot:2221158-Rhodomonas_salina.5
MNCNAKSRWCAGSSLEDAACLDTNTPHPDPPPRCSGACVCASQRLEDSPTTCWAFQLASP